MLHNVLVVSPSLDVFEALRSSLERASVPASLELAVDHSQHMNDVVTRIGANGGRTYDLVITEVEVPENRNRPVETGTKLGLEILNRVRSTNDKTPMVVIGDYYDEIVHKKIATISRAEYVNRENTEWEDWVYEISAAFLGGVASEEPEKKLEVDFILHNEGNYSYRMEVKGEPGAELIGPLSINEQILSHLVAFSSAASFTSKWEDTLKAIGEQLYREIFESNFDFARKFSEAVGRVQGMGNVLIRFVVEKKLHPIVLEAIKDSGEYFWMHQGPIYRRVGEHGNRSALFHDVDTLGKPNNFLLIQADIEERMFIPQLGLELSRLDNVREEVTWLREHLEALRAAGDTRIGRVETVDCAKHPASFKETVKNVLTRDEWHVVHYAGHSHFEDDSRTGRMFFPSEGAGSLEDISATAEEFANWTRKSDTRFISLSSCHSAEDDFVFELANKMVPAVIGFRWVIEDDVAKQFIKSFYENLMRLGSLEYAFFESKLEMHAMHRQNPVWASPILVIQSKRPD